MNLGNWKAQHASDRGYTLIELIIATALISILTILMMSFLVDKYVENSRVNARADLQLQTQITLDLINRDLKHSANVDSQNRWADANSPTSPANNFGWSSNSDTLIIARPVQDGSSNIIYEDPETYISYKDNLIFFVDSNSTLFKRTLAADVAGNQAETTCPADSDPSCPNDIKLADNIAVFNVAYFDAFDNMVEPTSARSVKITITVRRIIFGRELEISESIRTVFRNE